MNTFSPQEDSQETRSAVEHVAVPSNESTADLPSAFALIQQSLSFVQTHARGLLAIWGVYVAGLLIPAGALGLAGFFAWYSGVVVPETLSLLFIVTGGVYLLFVLIWSVVAGNALAYFVVKNGFMEGGVRGIFRIGLRFVVPGAWVSLLMMVSVFGGFILFAVPGIFLWVVFLCAYSVFLAEGKCGMNALAQSWYYVQGRWWSVFVLQLVWSLLTWVVFFVVSMGITFFASVFFGEKIGSILEQIVSTILNFIVSILAWIYYYHIYVALRALKPEPMTEDVEKGMRRKVYIALIIGIFGVIVFISLVVFLMSVALGNATF